MVVVTAFWPKTQKFEARKMRSLLVPLAITKLSLEKSQNMPDNIHVGDKNINLQIKNIKTCFFSLL